MTLPRPSTSDSPDAPGPRAVEDVTCLGCGCLCDDVRVDLDGGRAVGFGAACEMGRDWFQGEMEASGFPGATIDGRASELGVSLDRATEILENAKGAVVWGLVHATTEGVRAALEVAERVGARVILERSAEQLGRLAAFQQEGRVTSTLGEVKNRADVVVFWGCDPLRTHPRHAERYSMHPRGRFVPEGRAGRRVVVVHEAPNATAAEADDFLGVAKDDDVEAIVRLRRLVQDPSSAREDGATSELGRLASTLDGARYAAIFYQSRAETMVGASLGWQAMTRLVRELNGSGRCVLLGMGGRGNPAGAEAALTWQGGFPQGVDYRLGFPMPIDRCGTLDEALASGEVDAILVVDGALPAALSRGAVELMAGVPIVVVGPRATRTMDDVIPRVAIATSVAGIDAPGTVVRSDGVSLPLRTIREATFPSQEEILRGLRERLRARRGEGAHV